MQRNASATAKRLHLDLPANHLLSSLISGNAATPSPRGRGPRRIGVHGSPPPLSPSDTEASCQHPPPPGSSPPAVRLLTWTLGCQYHRVSDGHSFAKGPTL